MSTLSCPCLISDYHAWHIDRVASCGLSSVSPSAPLLSLPPSLHQTKQFCSSIMIIIACQCWLVPVPVDTVPFFFPCYFFLPSRRGDGRYHGMASASSRNNFLWRRAVILVRTMPLAAGPSSACVRPDCSTCDLRVTDGSPALKRALFLWVPIPCGASTTYNTP